MDPLAFFLSEKVADAESSDDPTRAALAVGGGGLGYRLLSQVIKHQADKGMVPQSPLPPYRGFQRLIDLAEPETRAALMGPSSFMGLGEVHSVGAPDVEHVNKIIDRLGEIHQTVDSFIDKYNLPAKGVRITAKGGLHSITGGEYRIPTREVIVPGFGKEVLLHELGHAADYTGSRMGRARGLLEPLLRHAATAIVPAALVAGDHIARAIPGTIDDDAIRFLQDHAPAAVAATLAATTLYPEAKASLLALKHIKEVEGSASMWRSAKPLAMNLGSYVIGAIPLIVGASLARRYLQEKRGEKPQRFPLEKKAGFGKDLVYALGEAGKAGYQYAKGTAQSFGELAKEVAHDPHKTERILSAAKTVGTSPEFVNGALLAAIPATIGAMYLYGTESGGIVREHVVPKVRGYKPVPAEKEKWREGHPLAFAGMVGLGAALSGGILAKLHFDLQKIV